MNELPNSRTYLLNLLHQSPVSRGAQTIAAYKPNLHCINNI